MYLKLEHGIKQHSIVKKEKLITNVLFFRSQRHFFFFRQMVSNDVKTAENAPTHVAAVVLIIVT